MGKSAKIARLRKDKYYQLAKEHGYRSRAAFKLIQLNRKFGFLNEASVVIDLCAAPGGWLQVVSNILPISSVIIGVDLFPIKPIKNVITLVNDITKPECLSNINANLNHQPVDCVLHDGAPNVGQAWEADAFGQAQLTLHAVRMASKVLKVGGWFVTKIFRSRDYSKLLSLFKKLFQHVHSTKPLASRKESAEIFVVCQGYIGLKNFDNSMLDFKNVFREQDEANDVSKTITLKSMFKQLNKAKPNRDGYNTDSQLLYTTLKLSEFLQLESNILNVLSKVNKIEFDVSTYDSLDITPDYIKQYCNDLKLLGYQEFKTLLDWRRNIREKFSISRCNEASPTAEENKQKIQLTDEQKLQKEIEQAEIDEAQNQKRQKRKQLLKNRLLKSQASASKKMHSEANVDLDNTGFFSKFFHNNQDHYDSLHVSSCTDMNDIDLAEIVDVNDNEKIISSTSSSDVEDNELSSLEKQLNAQMDFLKNASVNKKKQKYDSLADRIEKNKEDDINESTTVGGSDNLVTDEEDNDEELDMNFLKESTKPFLKKKLDDTDKLSYEDNDYLKKYDHILSSDETDDSIENNNHCNTNEEKLRLTPEMLALATRMKRSKKERENIIDSMWNRHCRGEENLPQWFLEDEANATRRILPITKQEVEQYKQMQKALEAQPTKKVMEARQRKKTKIEKLIEKARSKTDKLLDTDDNQNDVSVNQDKIDSAKRIYKKVAKELKRKKEKTYVVAKRHLVTGRRYNKPKSVSGPYKVVDPRQKKDKKQLNSAKKVRKTRKKRFTSRRKR